MNPRRASLPLSCSRILGCAGSIVQISEREAGTAEHAPAAPEVVCRHRAGPGAAVIVAVDAAGAGAAARVIELPAVHSFAALLAPGSVAAEAAHRRPVRHRRRRRSVEAREDAGRITDPAADDRQLGDGVGYFALGAREVVAVGHDQVGELAGLDPSLLALLVGEPGDVLGPQTQRRLAVEAVALRVDAQAPDRA